MNKKGFVLMETIIVIVVISVALLTLFSSYHKILTKLKAENRFDTSEYIYVTNHIKKYLLKNPVSEGLSEKIIDCDVETDIDEKDLISDYSDIKLVYNVNHIYLLKNINNIKKDIILKFDAYMIDYIRKLDVSDEDILIVVEYKKDDITDDIDASKTYISSLEW